MYPFHHRKITPGYIIKKWGGGGGREQREREGREGDGGREGEREIERGREGGRERERERERERGRQTDRQTDRQTVRTTEIREKKSKITPASKKPPFFPQYRQPSPPRYLFKNVFQNLPEDFKRFALALPTRLRVLEGS